MAKESLGDGVIREYAAAVLAAHKELATKDTPFREAIEGRMSDEDPNEDHLEAHKILLKVRTFPLNIPTSPGIMRLMMDDFSQQPEEHILQYFAYDHLPSHLQQVSAPFHDLAHSIVSTIPRNPERTVALRKLLEAKDAAVRARIDTHALVNARAGVSE